MDQSITLKIAGKDYPLKAATPEMEQIMRIAADAINKRLAQYDAKFPDKDMLAARDEGEKQLLDEMTSYLDSIDRK